MILFKGCPRCGGDIDTTYEDDVHCIQCAFRPQSTYAGPVLLETSTAAEEPVSANARRISTPVGCPRCALENVIPLEKLRPLYNTCYRCRECGHIFSPALPDQQSKAASGRS